MGELKSEVFAAAAERLSAFLDQSTSNIRNFTQASMQVVMFAMHEPKLFQLLFMTEPGKPARFGEMLKTRGVNPEASIGLLRNKHGLTHEQAEELFENAWVYTYGIGSLCATGMCSFTEEELQKKIETDFEAMLQHIA